MSLLRIRIVPLPAYKLAIFDFDGTLGDTMAWFLNESDAMAQRFGFLPIDRSNLDNLRHKSAREMMRIHKVPLLKLPMLAKHVQSMMQLDAGSIRLFDGVPEMLRTVHAAGVKIAVVSSNSEANIRVVLGPELSGLVARFDCGASVFGKARKFRKVMKTLGVKPSEAISIGDETRDIDAGRKAKLATAGVSWGYTQPQALADKTPDHMLGNVPDVVALLT